MSDAERLYSSNHVAWALGLSPAMTRRYAVALEQVTGRKIKQIGRDGRQYAPEDLAAMLKAKEYIENNPRMTVSDALKIALGLSPEPVAPEVAPTPQIGSQALQMAFSQALEQTLLPELRELRAEVARLRQEAQDRQVLPDDRNHDSAEDGPFVRFARRVESLFRR